MSHHEDPQPLPEKTHLCWKIGDVFSLVAEQNPALSDLIHANIELIGNNIWAAVDTHPNQDRTYSAADYIKLTAMFGADIATYADDFIAQLPQRPEDTDRTNLGPAVQSRVSEWLRAADLRE